MSRARARGIRPSLVPPPSAAGARLYGVNDDRPRLPTSTLRAVLNLGPKRSASLPLPPGLDDPEVDAELTEDEGTTAVYVNFEHGQLHLDISDDRIEHHFHKANGEVTDRSPFSRHQTPVLLEWAAAFARDVHGRVADLEEDAAEAAAWHDAGYSLYVCETEPAQLDLVEAEIEGEILMLPWLGAGSVDQQHADGDNHPVELLWSPTGEPDQPIARAWLDPRTEEPRTAGIPGVDWNDVGLSQPEALEWLTDAYLNHHVIEDPASAVFRAALRRIGGLDGSVPR